MEGDRLLKSLVQNRRICTLHLGLLLLYRQVFDPDGSLSWCGSVAILWAHQVIRLILTLAKKMRFVLESLHFLCLVWPHCSHGWVYNRSHHAEGLCCSPEQSKPLLPDTSEVLLHKWVKAWVRQRDHLGSLCYIDVSRVSLKIFWVLGCLQIIAETSSVQGDWKDLLGPLLMWGDCH